jgi:hypothetical protein
VTEDSRVSNTANRTNSTHRAVFLDSSFIQDIRVRGSAMNLPCQYRHDLGLHHILIIFKSGGNAYPRKSIPSIASFFFPAYMTCTEGPPPPPPTHVQNYGPQNNGNAQHNFQYSQCTGKKKALCVCFLKNISNAD